MVMYYAKHFTYITSHRKEAKSYFSSHPQSPEVKKRD